MGLGVDISLAGVVATPRDAAAAAAAEAFEAAAFLETAIPASIDFDSDSAAPFFESSFVGVGEFGEDAILSLGDEGEEGTSTITVAAAAAAVPATAEDGDGAEPPADG